MTIKHAISALTQAGAQLRSAVQKQRLRAQVVAAFRKIRNGIDDKAVYAITKDWYRSSGGEWTLGLS